MKNYVPLNFRRPLTDAHDCVLKPGRRPTIICGVVGVVPSQAFMLLTNTYLQKDNKNRRRLFCIFLVEIFTRVSDETLQRFVILEDDF